MLFSFLRSLQQRHARFVHHVHTAYRYPLPPAGRAAMGVVYFTTPVIVGWYIVQWAISHSYNEDDMDSNNIGALLEAKRQAARERRRLEKATRETTTTTESQSSGEDSKAVATTNDDGDPELPLYLGPIGTNPVMSTTAVQERNSIMVRKYLEQQQRKMKKKRTVNEDDAAQ